VTAADEFGLPDELVDAARPDRLIATGVVDLGMGIPALNSDVCELEAFILPSGNAESNFRYTQVPIQCWLRRVP
jgi:hypothetical protein